ncbi:hypothetical protein NSE_0652 [Neorickettsia sennetsu str. Miyayama]|uniref:Uncharacterized protein n=1 Tax=Ehrlichia sennetsu (strain ATCC VR-367 / Miyayama) TaxID=222891 RepID=Q2GDB6_EHRS3|nr:hypothetical protein NSE_0652 [Neorickettsia sennetsu str. Miyayama]
MLNSRGGGACTNKSGDTGNDGNNPDQGNNPTQGRGQQAPIRGRRRRRRVRAGGSG